MTSSMCIHALLKMVCLKQGVIIVGSLHGMQTGQIKRRNQQKNVLLVKPSPVAALLERPSGSAQPENFHAH